MILGSYNGYSNNSRSLSGGEIDLDVCDTFAILDM
jgi:hypothetical protein